MTDEQVVPPTSGRGTHDEPPPTREAADPTVHQGSLVPEDTPAQVPELHADAPGDHGGHAAHGDPDDPHAEPRLGPIDARAWVASVVGVAVAVVIVYLFYVAAT